MTRGLDLDDPRTMESRRQILRHKAFLRRIYDDWYREIVQRIPAGDGRVAELGSGPGFMRDYLPGLIASDVVWSPASDLALDGAHLPFASGSLRAIVMTNVLHHIHEPASFFREARRAVRGGGVVCMVEPWMTRWSRLAYRMHSESCLPNSPQWRLSHGGPLSGGNNALGWIIFFRDRRRFEAEFPEWGIAEITPQMPFRYLVSGGISLRSLMPAWSYELWRRVDELFEPWMSEWAMFAMILLRRR